MPVTAAPAVLRRRTGIAAGAALVLCLTATGCSGLGRTAVGPVEYRTAEDEVVSVNSPSVKGCHEMEGDGAREVVNETKIDMILYPTPDCSGGGTTYVATTFTDINSPRNAPWRSYRFVH
ncbi:hypothetical protein [Streptomyces sp. NPDC048590]|uniref:hypothetical protein n=1 Tax=Streptomyces sp. NPDC048590 TaxID=3365574 RepID=UPI003717C682